MADKRYILSSWLLFVSLLDMFINLLFLCFFGCINSGYNVKKIPFKRLEKFVYDLTSWWPISIIFICFSDVLWEYFIIFLHFCCVSFTFDGYFGHLLWRDMNYMFVFFLGFFDLNVSEIRYAPEDESCIRLYFTSKYHHDENLFTLLLIIISYFNNSISSFMAHLSVSFHFLIWKYFPSQLTVNCIKKSKIRQVNCWGEVTLWLFCSKRHWHQY